MNKHTLFSHSGNPERDGHDCMQVVAWVKLIHCQMANMIREMKTTEYQVYIGHDIGI